jgi:hypothetical protein
VSPCALAIFPDPSRFDPWLGLAGKGGQLAQLGLPAELRGAGEEEGTTKRLVAVSRQSSGNNLGGVSSCPSPAEDAPAAAPAAAPAVLPLFFHLPGGFLGLFLRLFALQARIQRPHSVVRLSFGHGLGCQPPVLIV